MLHQHTLLQFAPARVRACVSTAAVLQDWGHDLLAKQLCCTVLFCVNAVVCMCACLLKLHEVYEGHVKRRCCITFMYKCVCTHSVNALSHKQQCCAIFLWVCACNRDCMTSVPIVPRRLYAVRATEIV